MGKEIEMDQDRHFEALATKSIPLSLICCNADFLIGGELRGDLAKSEEVAQHGGAVFMRSRLIGD